MMDYRSKVKALMDKARGTDNADEAQIYAEKAAALAVKHGVQDALTESNEQSADTIVKTMMFGNPYFKQRITLLNAIARHLNCFVVRTGKYGANLFGDARDVERVTFLYRLLSTQMLTSVATERPTKSVYSGKHWYFKADGLTPAEVRSFRVNFLLGFITKVDARMAEAYAAAVAEAKASTPGVAIVLADRKALAKKLRDETHKNLTKQGNKITNREGFIAGTEAGANADLGQTQVTGRRALGA